MIEQSPQDNTPEKEKEQSDLHTMPVKPKQQIITDFVRYVERIKAVARSVNVLKYGQALFPIEPKVWDSNPWLLGTKQGVIDLRTGLLRAGRPQDHIHTIIPTEWKGLYEPAPRFAQFLQEIFADREETERDALIAFLQRTLGYGITGHVDEPIFLLFYSEKGSSGKGTLMHVLEKVLGKAVCAVSGDALLAATPESARPRLGNLQGKRIAWASDPDGGVHFASEEIKRLTSGKPIAARQIYGVEFTFTPTHLLILLTNHKPEADSSDRAFWNRLGLITFHMRFVNKPVQPGERQCDPDLAQALEAEASGILAWLVRGTLEWRHLGLAIPESVRKARQHDHTRERSFMDFVHACCVLDPQAQISAGDLYKRCKTWATDRGLTPFSHKQFIQEMKQVEQVTSQRNKRGMIYRGICLSKAQNNETEGKSR